MDYTWPIHTSKALLQKSICMDLYDNEHRMKSGMPDIPYYVH